MIKISLETIEEQINSTISNFHSFNHSGIVGAHHFSPITPKSQEETSRLIKQINGVDTLTTLIEDMHVIADNRIGVTRYIKKKAISILGCEEGTKGEDLLIRDATNQRRDQAIQKLEETPEAYMISMLGTTRGALMLVDSANNLKTEEKSALKSLILTKLKESLSENNTNSKVEEPKLAIAKVRNYESFLCSLIASKNPKIGSSLSTAEKVGKVLNDMRDIANLRDAQPHIATVWNGRAGSKITTIAAKVNPVSDKQKLDLQAIRGYKEIFYTKPKTSLISRIIGVTPSTPKDSHKLPNWYKELKPYQQKLIYDKVEAIASGQKTIATSLRFVPGLRNAYMEIDTNTNEEGTSIFNKVLRTGTVSYYSGKTPSVRKEVTESNIDHIKELAGPGKKIGLQIYNYNMFDEKIICRLAKEASIKKGVSFSQVGMQTSYYKDKMVDNILAGQELLADEAREKDLEVFQIISCKSGKDRTDFGSRLKKLFSYVNPFDNAATKGEIAENCAMAAHGETIAGSYGGNHGSLGLKFSGFLRYFSKIDVSSTFGAHEWLATPLIKMISDNVTAKLNKVKAKTKAADAGYSSISDSVSMSVNPCFEVKKVIPSETALALRETLSAKKTSPIGKLPTVYTTNPLYKNNTLQK